MGNIQKYYENTENALPHPLVQKVINMNKNPKYAINFESEYRILCLEVTK